MIKTVDGSQGEGGGQILRSSLALSMCTGTPIRLDNIRAGRKKPGLLRQHLTCVLASQAICNAKVEGAELGSTQLVFEPGDVKGGDYEFAIGTAGSTCLVFQTVLPALMTATDVSTLTLRGGTHNMMAPSFDFIKHSFLPVLRSMNIDVSVQLQAYGFNPAGGGEWLANIQPSSIIAPLELLERGGMKSQQAIVTQANIDAHVAERELAVVKQQLHFSDDALIYNAVQSASPGNILSLHLGSAGVTEVIETIGQKGVRAERVASRAVKAAKRYLQSGAVVGEHLCDQLLLPMALGNGGRFTTLKPTLHTLTNANVIQTFIDCEITIAERAKDCFEVIIEK